MKTPCPICDDDGWVDVPDEGGGVCGSTECPRLHDHGHAPFNASGLLPVEPTALTGLGRRG